MKFYVTFGQKYSYEPHPKVKYAHPDGFITVEAETEAEARIKTFEELGPAWAFMYPWKDKDEKRDHLYPLGILKEIK